MLCEFDILAKMVSQSTRMRAGIKSIFSVYFCLFLKKRNRSLDRHEPVSSKSKAFTLSIMPHHLGNLKEPLFKWAIPSLFFLYFSLFNTAVSKQMFNINLA